MSETKLQCPRCGSTSVTRHMTPMLPKEEGDVWAPRREEGYMCGSCRLIEDSMNDGDDYVAFRERWHDPIEYLSAEEHQRLIDERLREDDEAARAWTWPMELYPERVTDRARRTARLAESREWSAYMRETAVEKNKVLPPHKYGYPVGEEYTADVLAHPDDDAPRWAYARWLRTHDTGAAQASAEFIERQLRLASSLRADPRSDLKAEFPEDYVFAPRLTWPERKPCTNWYRIPGVLTSEDAWGRGLGDSTNILYEEGLIADERFFRGFVEHVTIKAHRFLEIADELFSLAPIRQLTITYCKGLQHDDLGLFQALLDSPHLDRIRALTLPVRAFPHDNRYTELNRLKDADIARLAESKHLRKLAYLNLDDQDRLGVDAFDALAASPNLPALSFVGHHLYSYSHGVASAWGYLGSPERFRGDDPLHRYAEIIEARRGRRIPWLHPVEHYGVEEPDVEAVVEHPVALLADTTKD